MTTAESAIAQLLLKNEIEEFLFQEAELLDERNIEEWLGLLTDDIRYWMPMRRNVRIHHTRTLISRPFFEIRFVFNHSPSEPSSASPASPAPSPAA